MLKALGDIFPNSRSHRKRIRKNVRKTKVTEEDEVSKIVEGSSHDRQVHAALAGNGIFACCLTQDPAVVAQQRKVRADLESRVLVTANRKTPLPALHTCHFKK